MAKIKSLRPLDGNTPGEQNALIRSPGPPVDGGTTGELGNSLITAQPTLGETIAQAAIADAAANVPQPSDSPATAPDPGIPDPDDTVNPYPLPIQHPRTDHPISAQPPEIVTGPQWGDNQSGVTEIHLLLNQCRHLFFICPDPRNDPSWIIYEPQLQDHKLSLNGQMDSLRSQALAIRRQLDQVDRFLGVTQ